MSRVSISVDRITGVVIRDGAEAVSVRVALTEVTDLCRKINNRATVSCPVDTGNLRSHHRVRVGTERSSVRGEVINDANYAEIVHDGSPPHTIRARRRRALRFTIGGRVIFARSVRHPGTSARPWLRIAAESVASSNGWTFERRT